MTVQLITENTLADTNFLSATEQAGIRIGQPVPGTNTGRIRLVSKSRSFGDEAINSTASADGAANGSTVVSGYFTSEGDDFYIGATITITAGAANGESKIVSDFTGATGTFTMASNFSAQIVSGVTFTITKYAKDMDFVIEIIASGDVGEGTFKWSHDGGTSYFGLRAYKAATHFGTSIYDTCHFPDLGRGTVCCQNDDGDVFVFLLDAGDGNDLVCYKASIPIHWSAHWSKVGKVYADEPNALYGCLCLRNGRILVYYEDSANADKVAYSDDDGVTWTSIACNMPVERAIELSDGVVIGIYGGSLYVRLVVSGDGGLTFSTTWVNHTIDAGDANGQCDVIEAANGDIVIAWREGAANFYIEGATSETRGGSWTNTGIAIANYDNPVAADKWGYPCLVMGPDGVLYCYMEYINGDDIYCTSSADHGRTWTDPDAPTLVGAGTHMPGGVVLLPNMKHLIAIYDTTANDVDFWYTGGWNVFAANAATMALGVRPMELMCGAQLIWHGSAAIDGDTWTAVPEYDYGMVNLIGDSPLNCWRSTQDNIACSIVIDMGAAKNHGVTGVAFFGCNIATLDFRMNDTDAWGAASVDQEVSFVLTTGALDQAPNDNFVRDVSLLANYVDHELRGTYLKFTSGVISGYVYKIVDNVSSYLVLDGDVEAAGAVNTNTFAIFRTSISKEITGGIYRYMQISIDAQRTAEGYYQIGTMVAGYLQNLSQSFGRGFVKRRIYDIEMNRSMGGGLLPVLRAERKWAFELIWPYADNAVREITALLDFTEGKNLALIPSMPTECYLVKSIGDVDMEHRAGDQYDLSLTLEESL